MWNMVSMDGNKSERQPSLTYTRLIAKTAADYFLFVKHQSETLMGIFMASTM